MQPVIAKHTRPLSASRIGGFTLIEALVALAVLSIGLLGVAGLQMAGLSANYSAAARTQASYLAYDILDRMRANRNDALAAPSLYKINLGATPSGTGQAALDLVAWKAAVKAALLQGDGAVDVTAGVATVTIQWNDAHGKDPAATADATLTFVTKTQL
jgi:type IV pilus assembly protein PilV